MGKNEPSLLLGRLVPRRSGIRFGLASIAILGCGASVFGAEESISAQPPAAWRAGIVADHSADGHTISVCETSSLKEVCNRDRVATFEVSEAARSRVSALSEGDRVEYLISNEKKGSLDGLRAGVARNPFRKRIWMLVFSFAVLYGFVVVLLRMSRLSAFDLVVGKDGRYSNSKTQCALWFGVLMASLLGTTLLRLGATGGFDLGLPSIPNSLLLVSGLSGATLGVAKMITMNRINQAAQDVTQQSLGQPPAPPPDAVTHFGPSLEGPSGIRCEIATRLVKPPADRAFPRDLYTNDKGQVDLGDFQMILITTLCIAGYVLQLVSSWADMPLLHAYSLPDITGGLATLLGVSQGSYLLKKYST